MSAQPLDMQDIRSAVAALLTEMRAALADFVEATAERRVVNSELKEVLTELSALTGRKGEPPQKDTVQ